MTIEDALHRLAKEGDVPIRADESDEHERAIAAIEAALKCSIDPIARSYLKLVPREPTGQWQRPEWMQWSYWRGFTLREMLRERKLALEHFGKHFHDQWLPLADNGGGDLLCVDPAHGGQIVEVRHDDSKRPRLAANLVEYLSHLEEEPEEKSEPQLPLLIVRFFVDGEPRPAKVSVYSAENPIAVATGETPASFRLPKGDYSVRFEHDGLTHWRRDVQVWSKQEIEFHW